MKATYVSVFAAGNSVRAKFLPLVVFAAFSSFATGQDVIPSVAVLRADEVAQEPALRFRATASLFDQNAQRVAVIEGLTSCQSVSGQNLIAMSPFNHQVAIVEQVSDRISLYDHDGKPIRTIRVPNTMAVAFGVKAGTLVCTHGERITRTGTSFINIEDGQVRGKLGTGGVAAICDLQHDSYWFVNNHVSHCSDQFELLLRRPLSRLPVEKAHPTVINSRNWCATGIALQPNRIAANRRLWVIERKHPDVRGSRNRLFAITPTGETRVLVELEDVAPVSIAVATDERGLFRVLVTDILTGDLLAFDSDGEQTARYELNVRLVAFSRRSGLWVLGKRNLLRLKPADLTVMEEFEFGNTRTPLGLSAQ